MLKFEGTFPSYSLQIMGYEANNVQEAITVRNRILILVSSFQQPRKQVWSIQIWKTVTTITLWALWKCWCNQRYDATYQCLSDVLREIWENLLAVVRGQYNNMQGSLAIVNKRKKKLLHLWKKLPLFTESSQGPQWNYQLPWTFLEY